MTIPTLPTVMTGVMTLAFLVAERVFPGRELPQAKGWYVRAFLINLSQLAITLLTARQWRNIFGDVSLLHLERLHAPMAEGFIAWFVGTFFFYWWHRLRHVDGFWLLFHQVHHSPSRIELATSFYKHPIEIFCDAVLSAMVIYPLLGCSMDGAFWYNFFASTGEYFYHANLRTPAWLRFLIQTPELHSVHHQYNLHAFNYADIPLWDYLFGTHKDTTVFAKRCGFPIGAEEKLFKMLAFRDVYVAETPSSRLAP